MFYGAVSACLSVTNHANSKTTVRIIVQTTPHAWQPQRLCNFLTSDILLGVQFQQDSVNAKTLQVFIPQSIQHSRKLLLTVMNNSRPIYSFTLQVKGLISSTLKFVLQAHYDKSLDFLQTLSRIFPAEVTMLYSPLGAEWSQSLICLHDEQYLSNTVNS